MSIDELKQRLADIPGIQDLTMQSLVGRHVYGFNGLIAGVDPNATPDQVEAAIRATAALGVDTTDASPAPALTVQDIRTLPTATPLPTVNMTEPKPKTAPVGSFAASIRKLMDEARSGVAQARADGLAKVGEAVGMLNDAKTATAHVAGTMAKAIAEEADAVMAELGQISNSLGGENG